MTWTTMPNRQRTKPTMLTVLIWSPFTMTASVNVITSCHHRTTHSCWRQTDTSRTSLLLPVRKPWWGGAWVNVPLGVTKNVQYNLTIYTYVQNAGYCKTLNVCVPFISRAKNREIKRHEWQLQAKNRTKLLQYFEFMVLIRQNKIKGAKIILHAKSPTFRAAKLKGFTV